MSDLSKLQESVAKATGGDREIDALLASTFQILPDLTERREQLVDGTALEFVSYEDGEVVVFLRPTKAESERLRFLSRKADRFTSSIDAALSLVTKLLPEPNCYGVAFERGKWEAYVSRNFVKSGHWHQGFGATGALALIAALLSAIASQTPEPPDA